MAGALPDSGSREVSSFVETNASAAIRCWGPQGSAVQAGLANATAAPYLTAGGFRACTVLASGAALCSGADDVGAAANASTAGALPRDLFGYGLAVGDSHACALRRPNHTAVCWSLRGPPPPCTSRRSGSPSSSSSPAATSRAASRPAPVIWSVGKLGSIFRKNEFSSVERFS